jgi:hypothetical protein
VTSVTLGEPSVHRLGNAKVDDLGNRPSVLERHQDVGGLQVAVDDPLLVRVLDSLADLNEELDSLSRS